MKVHHVAVCCTIFLLLLILLPIYKASCQDYTEYNIKINSDRSATWLITKVSDVNASIDTWTGFQEKIFTLVDSAASITKREMAIDETSLQINTTISGGSKTTEYLFIWQNFSVAKNGELIFGDAFGVSGFFMHLYGDSSVQISYPSNYNVKTVSPTPNGIDESGKTMQWFRSQDLVNGNPSIVLVSLNSLPDTGNASSWGWQTYAFIGAGLSVVILPSLGGFLFYKRRKSNNGNAKENRSISMKQIESGDDKILGLLKVSGGTLRQSVITEQSGFSKAKISQLLAVLEKSGVIIRYKRGRDKIVVLNERAKRDKL
jgi:uncharacterized membrane protein